MSSSLAPLNQGRRSDTRSARARTPSVASTMTWTPSQKNASRYSNWMTACAARKAKIAPDAVYRCATQAITAVPRCLGVSCPRSETAHDGGEILPDGNAAEVRSLGTPWGDEAVANHARRTKVPADARVQRANRGDLVHRREVDLLLRVEAGAQRPLMQQRQQRA